MPTANDDAPRTNRRIEAFAVGVILLLWTVIAAPILTIAAISFSDARTTLDAYNAAPTCAASASSDASCRKPTEYRVSDEYGHAGQDSVYYLYLTDADNVQTRIQLVSDTGVWPAATGETVTVTSWHGTPVTVSDGRNVSPLVGSPVHGGDGAYTVLVLVGAIYVFMVLFTLMPRLVEPLMLVPLAIVIAGIALHGRIVGGPWAHDWLLIIVASLGLLMLIELLSKRRKRTGQR